MSYALPQEAKASKKFTSLPDDLAKIARELVRDKFKGRELSDDSPFPIGGPDDTDFTIDPQYMQQVGCECYDCLSRRRTVRPYTYTATNIFSLDSLYELLTNALRGRSRRDQLEWQISCMDFDYLTRDIRSSGAVGLSGVGKPGIFGIPVYFDERHRGIVKLRQQL